MGGLLSHAELRHLIAVHGYWLVAGIIGLESAGLPLPGETVLIAAALYAGGTGQLDIALVILAATLGAVAGGHLGYAVGRRLGLPLLLRYGRYVWVNEAKIKLGQYLFLRHGGKVVVAGRFLPVLRSLASFLAGVNRMPGGRFALFNAVGALAWAGGWGLAADLLAGRIHQVAGRLGLALAGLAVLLLAGAFLFLRRHHAELQRQAELTFPGPLGAETAPLG